MTGLRLIQNFSGMQAHLVVAPTTVSETLVATLMKLGLTVASTWPAGDAHPVDWAGLEPERALLIVDGDLTLPGNAASTVSDLPPVPVLGLVGVEAPSRLKGLLQFGATGLLRKPIRGASVYAALYLTINEHQRRGALEEQLARHKERRRGRRHVVKAILRVMQERGLDDEAAFEFLRRDSMRVRLPLEHYCEALVQARPDVPAPARRIIAFPKCPPRVTPQMNPSTRTPTMTRPRHGSRLTAPAAALVFAGPAARAAEPIKLGVLEDRSGDFALATIG